MVLQRIRARGFRNIEEGEISFSPDVNLLYGKNAEGKTNLLEAIYYFARGKSFRGATDGELCRFGGRFYEIEAAFHGDGRDRTLLYRYAGREKVRLKNGAPASSAADMIGVFRAVLFHPEHLSLVKGAPSLRREFLNVAISQVRAEYIGIYAVYQRILDQRNSLLKAAGKGLPFSEEELCIWSERLAGAAARVAAVRYDYMKLLSPNAEALLSSLSEGRERLSLSYRCEVEEDDIGRMEERYRTLLLSDHHREIGAGFTVFGPHHDDIEMQLSGHPAREFASQGQQRSITLALKLGEGEVSNRLFGEYPVFLFDDVMSELDGGRRTFLLSALAGRQIIVTACDERDFTGTSAHLIRTEGGRYEAVSQ